MDKGKNAKPTLTKYRKEMALKTLKSNGFNKSTLKIIENKKNSEGIIDFIWDNVALTEQRVNYKYESMSLKHIHQWLDLLKETELSTLCGYESAAVLNSIVNNEIQPDPSTFDGIDMTQVYKFLENSLTGQPQGELNEASKSFLSKEIELLVAEANNEVSDELARKMGSSLQALQPTKLQDSTTCSIDPFLLDDDRDNED